MIHACHITALLACMNEWGLSCDYMPGKQQMLWFVVKIMYKYEIVIFLSDSSLMVINAQMYATISDST